MKIQVKLHCKTKPPELYNVAIFNRDTLSLINVGEKDPFMMCSFHKRLFHKTLLKIDLYPNEKECLARLKEEAK